MSSVDQKEYTCDRCGAKAMVPVPNPNDCTDLPEGWQLLDGPSGAMPDLCGTCVRAFWQDFMHCAPFGVGDLPKRTVYMRQDLDEVRTVVDVRREVLEKVIDIVELTSNRDAVPYTYNALYEAFGDELPSKARRT